jgi:hypothetical protein
MERRMTRLINWTQSPAFLRQVLLADAAISGLTGLLMAAGAGVAGGLFALPADLLRYAGLALLPYAAFVALVGASSRISRPAVWTVIAANGLWAAGSLLLLASGLIAPTLLGYLFVVAQAVVVAILGELQFMGLRRLAAATQ